MKLLTITCPNPNCGTDYQLDESYIDKKILCPQCKQHFYLERHGSGALAKLRIVCPGCQAEYAVNPGSLGQQRCCTECGRRFLGQIESLSDHDGKPLSRGVMERTSSSHVTVSAGSDPAQATGAKERATARHQGARAIALLLSFAVIAAVCLLWPKIRELSWSWQAVIAGVVLVVLARSYLLTTRRGAEQFQVGTAQTLINAGKHEDALKRLEVTIEANPGNSEAWYLKGRCLDRLGRTVEADAAWEEALKQNPRHASAAHDLACDCMNRRDFLLAAKYLSLARDANAGMVEPTVFRKNTDNLRKALVQLGHKAEGAGDFTTALKYADAIIDVDPDYPLGFAWRAKQHVSLGHYREAIDDAKTCLRLDPGYTKVNNVIQAAEEELNRVAARQSLGHPTTRTAGDEMFPTRCAHTQDTADPKTPAVPTLKAVSTDEQSSDKAPSGRTLWQVGEKVFGRVEIRKVIHEGGMGTIYCGWDEKSKGPVALKAIQLGDDAEQQAELAKHFRQEAEHWFRLGDHPRIVTLYSVEKVDHRHIVLAMEYIAGNPEVGPTLRHLLNAKKQLPIEDAVQVAIGISEAVGYAHEKARLVHRDLKPSNVFLTVTGQVKVGDFGLAVPDGTLMGRFAGTAEYAPLEQLDGSTQVAPTMDVYSIGVILFEMVCGRRPFELSEEYRDAHPSARPAIYCEVLRTSTPPDPAMQCPRIPGGLRRVILGCLSKDSSKRPADYARLKASLLPFAGKGFEETQWGTTIPADDPAFVAYKGGVSANSLGLLEEAVRFYQEAVQHEPYKSQYSDAWANLAKVFGELRRFDESVAAARRALRTNPDDLKAKQSLAMSLSMKGELSEAKLVIDSVLAANDGEYEAHICEGWILFRLGKVPEAVEAYERAVEIKDDIPQAHFGLGVCAEAAGHPSEALDFFDRAISLKQDFGDAYNNRVRVLLALGQDEDALKSALRAVECDSKNALYQVNLGLACGKLRRFEQAIEPLEIATQLEPGNASAWLVLAQVYGETKQYPKAVQAGQRAVQLGESSAMGVVKMAEQLMRSGTAPGAVTQGLARARPNRPVTPGEPRGKLDWNLLQEVVRKNEPVLQVTKKTQSRWIRGERTPEARLIYEAYMKSRSAAELAPNMKHFLQALALVVARMNAEH